MILLALMSNYVYSNLINNSKKMEMLTISKGNLGHSSLKMQLPNHMRDLGDG